MISRLPWLRGMFSHRSACCLGHLRERRLSHQVVKMQQLRLVYDSFYSVIFILFLNPIQVKIPIKNRMFFVFDIMC